MTKIKAIENNRINFKGIIDTTLRDGQQSPLLFDTFKYRFNLEDKKLLINGLIKLGISHIEFFSPAVGEIEKYEFLEIKRYIQAITSKKIFLLSHCRCHEKDISEALNLGFDGLNLYMGISQYAQKYSLKHNFREILKLIKNIIITTRRNNPDLYIRFSVEDSFRTHLKNIYQVFDEVYQYVDTLGIPDTTGIATPFLVKERINLFKSRYPDINLECHFHNDRGLALINAMTAIFSGVEYLDTSVWGLAERSGITSLTGLLFNLFFVNSAYCKNYNLNLCYPLNILLASILGIQVPVTEPVSLTNRTHTAGVHQKAVLNQVKVYEAHDLEKFGVTKNQILLGPLSGWNLIYYYLKEVEGYNLSRDQAKEITRDYKRQIGKINKEFRPEVLLQNIVDHYPLIKVVLPEDYQAKRIENLT